MRARNAKRLAARFEQAWVKTTKKSLIKKLIIAGLVVAVASTVRLWPYWFGGSVQNTATASASGLRTVIVIDGRKAIGSEAVRSRQCHLWLVCQNGKDHIDVVVLKKGHIPSRPTKAVVQTDNDCAADFYGNSHCTNRLQLSDGQVIEVQHDHNMQIYPCLTPGETVEVEAEPHA